ncbi:OLC1v1024087C1 [Oldenlandia corymbosa var. corymbosa]|uniref:OLC1v1024087C1 n=1 Tax=Oldenlandia corymbosa var. corymbosa TaxID=529605 RepID=A0AAV1C1Q2_OLDCO|nr:OLC1v1024087C1 [Oldenlandia corymbosa var. corymbosa]
MVGSGVEPNGFTLSAVVKACSELGELKLGKCFHGVVIKCNFDTNHVIASSLIDMYGRNNEAEDSRKRFDELLEPDAICWTSVISAYTRNDLYEKALSFFYLMHRGNGLFPDGHTFGSLLTALGNLGWLRQCKQVHAMVVTEKNAVTWCALLGGYCQKGDFDTVIQLFRMMDVVDLYCFGTILRACSGLAAVRPGKEELTHDVFEVPSP